MQAMINLVATRQKAGKPAELLRWYNDHVNLLMGFENLTAATLYRRTSADTEAAPDYVCLYDFPDASAFAAFEASDAKERARQVTASGWGRQGIEIIQRTQYTNGGKWTGPTSSAESGCHIQCLDMTTSTANAAPEASLKRWLADTLHEAAAQTGAGHYEWYVSAQQQAIVLAGAGAASARLDPAWHTWWHAPPATEPLGQPPSAVNVCWQAGYERVSAWRR